MAAAGVPLPPPGIAITAPGRASSTRTPPATATSRTPTSVRGAPSCRCARFELGNQQPFDRSLDDLVKRSSTLWTRNKNKHRESDMGVVVYSRLSRGLFVRVV